MPRIFACGDVHGMLDSLQAALEGAGLMRMDPGGPCWVGGDATLVTLGDYIDRGWKSKQVVDLLIDLRAQAGRDGGRIVSLWGNHERMMYDGQYIEGEGKTWYANGGRVAASSYGIGIGNRFSSRISQDIMKIHGDFYNSLLDFFVLGDTLFIHGGVRPDANMDQLKAMVGRGDVTHLWIREQFYNHPTADFVQAYGVERIVFGHTVHQQVTPRHGGRLLAIDTGAPFPGGCVSIVELLPDLKYRIAGQGYDPMDRR